MIYFFFIIIKMESRKGKTENNGIKKKIFFLWNPETLNYLKKILKDYFHIFKLFNLELLF